MKVFISVPMRGRSDSDIRKDIERAKQVIHKAYKTMDEPIEYVDNMIEKPEGSERLYCLGEAVKKIGECDAVCFYDECFEYPGCRVEHEVAISYRLAIIVFNDNYCAIAIPDSKTGGYSWENL